MQTGPEGVARIAFADGTTYTVKGDTLVTVEENLVEQDHASSVGVHITSGQVDLATGTWEVPGSKAEVSFENAVASLQANTPRGGEQRPRDQAAGNHGGVRQRGIEPRQRARRHRAVRESDVPHRRPDDEVASAGAAELVQPLNLQPIIVDDPEARSGSFFLERRWPRRSRINFKRAPRQRSTKW